MPTRDDLLINRSYRISFFDIRQDSSTGKARKVYLENRQIFNSVNFSFQYSVTNNTTNIATFRFYNIAEDTIALFTSPDSQRGFTLDCWYGEEVRKDTTIFSGIVAQVNTYFEGPNVITEIKAGDLFINLFVQGFSRKYLAGANYAQIIADLLDYYGHIIAIDSGCVDLLISKVLKVATVIRGQFQTVLSRLASDAGLFYIVHGDYLTFVDAATFGQQSTEPRQLISAETGLVGYPRAIAISQQLYPVFYTRAVVLNKNLSLVQATTYIDSYVLYSTVQLKSKNLSGYYNVLSCVHAGEWRGNQWYTNLILWPVPKVPNVSVELTG